MSRITESFRLRGRTVIAGVRLLVDYGISHGDFDTSEKSFLHSDIDRLADQYENNISLIEDFRSGQIYLDSLLKRLILFVETEVHLERKDVFDMIVLAERFATWQQGRSKLTSTVHMSPFTVKQVEEPICQLSEEQRREFLRLLHDDFPAWSKTLSDWQKNYICGGLADIPLEKIDQKILTIPSSLRRIPGLANYSLHHLEIYDQSDALLFESRRFCTATPSATNIVEKDERRRLTKQNIVQILERQLGEVSGRFLDIWQPVITPGQILASPVLIQTLLSPIWIDVFISIFCLKCSESHLLADKEYSILRIREKLASGRGIIEVRKGEVVYRIDPLLISTNYPINFLRQETLLIKSKTGRNNRNAIRLLQCFYNFIDDIVLPKFGEGKGYHVGLFKHFLKDVLRPMIQRNSIFFTLSLSLPTLGPKVRRFRHEIHLCLNALHATFLSKNKPEEVERLQAALTVEQLGELKLLFNAIRDYITLYNTIRKWIHHKEMFLSGLEEIIAERLGGISCSSALESLNRKGMQTLHTDAMLIYYKRYGVLPVYNDSSANRRRFVEIFVNLFYTQHQQRHAGQNVPGSDGIRGIIVLPFAPGMHMVSKDIVKEIKRRDKRAIREGVKFAKLAKSRNPFSLTFAIQKYIKGVAFDLYRVVVSKG